MHFFLSLKGLIDVFLQDNLPMNDVFDEIAEDDAFYALPKLTKCSICGEKGHKVNLTPSPEHGTICI